MVTYGSLGTNSRYCLLACLLLTYWQCWEGHFGNVIGYRLQVTLLKM